MGKCEAGCKYFTGNEVKHHRDCFYYKDSLSELQDKREKRITALEALAKQMAEALKQILNTKHDKSEWLARRLLAERALDAYKRGINE